MDGFCRGCLIKYNEPMELLQYTEKNRRLFVYSTGLQVKRNDTFTFQLCKDCFLNMKQACKFKKLCRTSDKRFRNYLALKDVGDPVDFCTFLKNSDDTLTFRFPMLSGNSTPANQKCRDDDNESTCTSIRNFMTDILQGEDMPDTEAQIIKEVIEEEADLLDDSLDSHWLQDDMSIDTDFRLDFSFSPFSTPRSVNNDRCYTPKQREEQVEFNTLNSEKQTKILNDFTNAFKSDENIKELNGFSGIEKSESFKNIKQFSPFGIDEIDSIHKPEDKTLKNNQNLKDLSSKFGIDGIDGIEKSRSNVKSNQSLKELLKNLDAEKNHGVRKSENSSVKSNQSVKELCDFSLDSNHDKEKEESKIDKNVQSLKELCDFSLDSFGSIEKSGSNTNKHNHSITELCNLSLNDLDDTVKSESNTFKNGLKEICDFSIDEIDGVEKSDSHFDLPSLDVLEKDKINIPDFYTPKDFIESIQSNNDINNSSINIEALLEDKPCTIDKNLEEALRNADNNDFSLDDLLVSPPVFPVVPAASTPTVTEILFGEKLDMTDTNTVNKIGQCIEPYHDLQGDIEIFEEFFQNDTKEFDLEDIKRENREFQSGDWKKPIGVNDVEVNNKENELKNIDMDISFGDEDEADNNYDKAEPKSENEPITHISSSTPNDKFDIENSYCKLCEKKFNSGKALSIHFSKIHNIKIVKPKYDRQKLKHKSILCNKCGKQCRDRSNFARHQKKCLGLNIIKCERCMQEFMSQANLEKHMTIHTNMKKIQKNMGKEYVCTICGTILRRYCNLVLHMRRHKKEYSASCKKCGKGFYSRSDLERHMRMHTGDTPFSCTFCPRLFTRKDGLTRHILAHLDERLFQCDYCGLRCIKKYDLIKHIQKNSCRKITKKGKTNDIDMPVTEQGVNVIYTTGSDTVIKTQLPFLETERSN